MNPLKNSCTWLKLGAGHGPPDDKGVINLSWSLVAQTWQNDINILVGSAFNTLFFNIFVNIKKWNSRKKYFFYTENTCNSLRMLVHGKMHLWVEKKDWDQIMAFFLSSSSLSRRKNFHHLNWNWSKFQLPLKFFWIWLLQTAKHIWWTKITSTPLLLTHLWI